MHPRMTVCCFFSAFGIKDNLIKGGENKMGIGLQDSEQDYVLSGGQLQFRGLRKRITLAFQRFVNLDT